MLDRAVVVARCVVIVAVAAGAPAAAQDQITNGRVEPIAATGRIETDVRALAGRTRDPFWVGYAMPVVEGERVMCCVASGSISASLIVSSGAVGRCSGCRLEPGDAGPVSKVESSGPIRLEGATEFVVLTRIDGGEVVKVRTFSPDCPLDAGGRTVYWLTGLAPAASVEWLSGFAAAGDTLGASAIGAIALHRTEAADRVLDGLVAAGRPLKVREKAAFWLGTARGPHGFQTLSRLLESDASDDFRRRAIFAISQSDQPGALDTLIARARADASARVRAEAIFRLARKAGRRAVGALTEAVERDPDTAVKKRAVFALSRLPNDEGVPKLIEVARTNRNPEVRKQAMFWLGRSKDPRALAFFEEILRR